MLDGCAFFLAGVVGPLYLKTMDFRLLAEEKCGREQIVPENEKSGEIV